MIKLLSSLGIVSIIAGFILGIYEANQISELAKALDIDDDSFQWSVAFTWWISGAISGILFIAFSSMLEHLESLQAEIKVLKKALNIPGPFQVSTSTSASTYTPFRETGNPTANLSNVAKDGFKMKSFDNK